ncbi:calponin homology domain-containing protein DDB_G0272472-like [Periplaneta americana]|uniref:calponin homology domain-containing protein DDB_G0272472-like n=1 Tax=Periplaneta americana TaxID=6978 RepID=UPI0037E79863
MDELQATLSFLHEVTKSELQEFTDVFQENMSWLNEVTEEISKNIAQKSCLIPKTPTATRRLRMQRKPLIQTVPEDEVMPGLSPSSVAGRSSAYSTRTRSSRVTRQNSLKYSPARTRGRGSRAASKIAHKKITEHVTVSISKKLRRPSVGSSEENSVKKLVPTVQIIDGSLEDSQKKSNLSTEDAEKESQRKRVCTDKTDETNRQTKCRRLDEGESSVPVRSDIITCGDSMQEVKAMENNSMYPLVKRLSLGTISENTRVFEETKSDSKILSTADVSGADNKKKSVAQTSVKSLPLSKIEVLNTDIPKIRNKDVVQEDEVVGEKAMFPLVERLSSKSKELQEKETELESEAQGAVIVCETDVREKSLALAQGDVDLEPSSKVEDAPNTPLNLTVTLHKQPVRKTHNLSEETELVVVEKSLSNKHSNNTGINIMFNKTDDNNSIKTNEELNIFPKNCDSEKKFDSLNHSLEERDILCVAECDVPDTKTVDTLQSGINSEVLNSAQTGPNSSPSVSRAVSVSKVVYQSTPNRRDQSKNSTEVFSPFANEPVRDRVAAFERLRTLSEEPDDSPQRKLQTKTSRAKPKIEDDTRVTRSKLRVKNDESVETILQEKLQQQTRVTRTKTRAMAKAAAAAAAANTAETATTESSDSQKVVLSTSSSMNIYGEHSWKISRKSVAKAKRISITKDRRQKEAIEEEMSKENSMISSSASKPIHSGLYTAGKCRNTPLSSSNISNTSAHSASRVYALCNSSKARFLMNRQPGNIVFGVETFIPKQYAKSTLDEIQEKKEEEIKRRMEREVEVNRKRAQGLKQKVEEKKRKREEKMLKVLKTKQALEKQKQDTELRLQREKEEKLKQVMQEREDKMKEQMQQKKQYAQQKAAEIEERRRQEEAARLAKLKEQEEEQRRLQAARKKEQEEAERHQLQLLAEEREAAIQRQVLFIFLYSIMD